MSSSTIEEKPSRLTAAVLTISDSSARGKRLDVSGPAVAELLKESGFHIVASHVVEDDSIQIQNSLCQLTSQARFVVTTGGTGISERDITPEATRAVCDRLVEGVPERMRSAGFHRTPNAVLSRGICGLRGKSIILNLPGNPSGAVESLQAVLEIIPHALSILEGNTEHD
jgi:molybdopterin adenylyltransferase